MQVAIIGLKPWAFPLPASVSDPNSTARNLEQKGFAGETGIVCNQRNALVQFCCTSYSMAVGPSKFHRPRHKKPTGEYSALPPAAGGARGLFLSLWLDLYSHLPASPECSIIIIPLKREEKAKKRDPKGPFFVHFSFRSLPLLA